MKKEKIPIQRSMKKSVFWLTTKFSYCYSYAIRLSNFKISTFSVCPTSVFCTPKIWNFL